LVKVEETTMSFLAFWRKLYRLLHSMQAALLSQTRKIAYNCLASCKAEHKMIFVPFH